MGQPPFGQPQGAAPESEMDITFGGPSINQNAQGTIGGVLKQMQGSAQESAPPPPMQLPPEKREEEKVDTSYNPSSAWD